MLQTVTGIVLNTLKYSDTTNIVDLYTDVSGRGSFLVSASRSRKSPVKPVLFQPLAMIEFEADLRPRATIYRIKEAKSAYPFATIPYDPYKSSIALFLAEFMYRAIQKEAENQPLFAYLESSIAWLDTCSVGFANFHLVFLMRLTRFLGLFPNLEDYHQGDYFDLLNACFIDRKPTSHTYYIDREESFHLTRVMRMNYESMHLFPMSRAERNRCLNVMIEYYKLHVPGFPDLKSLRVLQELFD